LYEMGYPPDWFESGSHKFLFGSEAEWLCPAPKRASQNIRPPYIYVLLQATHFLPGYLQAQHEKHGDSLPFISDLNHNDHSKVSMYAPRVRKRVLYVDLQGRVVTKTVTGTFELPGSYAPYEL
jgi:hypothetical protein